MSEFPPELKNFVISEFLNQRHTFEDAALLRRFLCDLGYLERTRDGREYWRTTSDAPLEA